jgi:hypothetical protein
LIIYRNAHESREDSAEHDSSGCAGNQPELGTLSIRANEHEPGNACEQGNDDERRHDYDEARVDDLLQLNEARGSQLRARLRGPGEIAEQDTGVKSRPAHSYDPNHRQGHHRLLSEAHLCRLHNRGVRSGRQIDVDDHRPAADLGRRQL